MSRHHMPELYASDFPLRGWHFLQAPASEQQPPRRSAQPLAQQSHDRAIAHRDGSERLSAYAREGEDWDCCRGAD